MATSIWYDDNLVLEVGDDGLIVNNEGAVNDLIGTPPTEGVTVVAIPVDHLAADFFKMRSGAAGAIPKKMSTIIGPNVPG